MSIYVTQLGRGIPEGDMPQLQRVRDTKARVLVSEDTRRAAHQLDDMHREWIVRKQADELDDCFMPSPFASENAEAFHVTWLTDIENAPDRYAMVLQRRLLLETELRDMRKTGKIEGENWNRNAFYNHQQALKLEWVYVCALQAQLKGIRINPIERVVNAKVEYLGDVLSGQGGDESLVVLAELRAALVEWLRATGSPDLSPRLANAIKGSREFIRERAMLSMGD